MIKTKYPHFVIEVLILLCLIFSAPSKVTADNLFLTADELLTNEDIQYDNHYFKYDEHTFKCANAETQHKKGGICFPTVFNNAKQDFIDGNQQSWSLHAYVAGLAKMYEATLDPRYFDAFRKIVKLISDMRSDNLDSPLGDQLRGSVTNPKVVKAWVAYEKSYGNAVWDGTEAMTALGNQLFIVQNSRLHEVESKKGQWEVFSSQNGNEAMWDGTEAMTVLGGQLFIVQNSRLHKVNHENGNWNVLSDQNGNEAVWDGTEAMTTLGEHLFIVQNSRLHEVNPRSGHWRVLLDQNGNEAMWDGTKAMTAYDEYLFIVQNSRLHKVNPDNGHWSVLSDQSGNEDVWDGTEAMTALDEHLFIVQNSRLHKVAPENGHWSVLSNKDGDKVEWNGAKAMVALDHQLFIVKKSELYKVYFKDGHWYRDVISGRFAAQIHETAMYSELILWYSRIVIEDPDLRKKYGAGALELAQGAMEAIHEFNTNLEKSYYVIPEEVAPWSPKEAGKPEPYNIAHLMLRALIELTKVIHSDYYQASSYSSVLDGTDYRKLAPKILADHQTYFKNNDWKYGADDTIIWPRYPDNWWYKNDNKYVTDDVSHASVTIEYILKLYENQGFLNNLLAKSDSNNFIEVTLEDIKKIANTFLFNIERDINNNYPGEIKDIFFNAHMDGSSPYVPYMGHWKRNGSITGWIQLSLGDKRVFEECAETAFWIDGLTQPFMEDGGVAYFPYILKEKNDRYKNIFISFDGSTEIVTNSPALGTLTPKDILIGDFDGGDGDDDILAKSQSFLYVSWSGKSGWSPFGRFDLDIKYLGSGDFDGNGTTDLFYRDDQNQWMARFHDVDSRKSPSTWKNIGASVNDVPNIHFGDFDGNGVTDIFRIKEVNG